MESTTGDINARLDQETVERKAEGNLIKNGLEEEKLLRGQENEIMKKSLADTVQVNYSGVRRMKL